MSSQIALHPKLKNRFIKYDLSEINTDSSPQILELMSNFEKGNILVFDNCKIDKSDYFFDQPGKWFPDWVPPIFSSRIRKKYSANHELRKIYDSEYDILEFKKNIIPFEESWLNLLNKLFPKYDSDLSEISYRFNHMDLGNLHLDVPDEEYEGHQFRCFINLDKRPRILAVGPTIFELAELCWEDKKISRFNKMSIPDFIQNFRSEILDQTIFKERELPRHYLTLDPGSMWISHSSYISHGLVYGRKTACVERHIKKETLYNKFRHFNSMIRVLQESGPLPENEIEAKIREGTEYGG